MPKPDSDYPCHHNYPCHPCHRRKSSFTPQSFNKRPQQTPMIISQQQPMTITTIVIIIVSIITLLSRITNAKDDAGLPVILEHPLDTIIAKGDPVTLKCQAEGNPKPTISWYREGHLVSTAREESNSHRVLLPTGALFFLRVHSGKNGKKPDSGTYWCTARNSLGEVRSRNASLRIAMLREEFRTRPRNVQAVVGQEQAMIECSPPRGFPEPVVTWKKDGRDIRPEADARVTVHSSGNIIIGKVEQSDGGFYTCVAKNMVGTKESNPARLSVYQKPTFLKRPNDVTTEVGTDILFACRVNGDPMPVIVWRKKEGKMPLGRAQIMESKGLRVDRVLPSDEGEYICQAKNPAGTIEASARLIVHAPPTFQKKPYDQEVEEGGSVSFECVAGGNPLPARFWSREGDQELMFPGYADTVADGGRVKVTTGGTLMIDKVESNDDGVYVCSALNAAGSNVVKVQLKVAGKSLLKEPPPIIVHGPANQTLPVEGLAILPCRAIGRTQPSVTWTKNGKTLDTDSSEMERYSQLASSGALRIDELQLKDSGIFTCTAENPDGQTTWSAHLQVEKATNPAAHFHRMSDPSTYPSAPSSPIGSNITESSVTLTWQPPNKQGASGITGYILQYYSPEQGQTWFNVPDHIRDPRFTVKNLKPGSNYIFLVRAENTEGIGEPSSMSAPIRTKGKGNNARGEEMDLELARQRFGQDKQLVKLMEVKALNSTAVKLFWKPLRSEPLISGFYIRWKGPSSTADDSNFANASGANSRSWTVNGLEPFRDYTFFIVPYYRTVEGVPSNTLNVRTLEARPTVIPEQVKVRMMNLTTLRISWRPPAAKGVNGILSGYRIVVSGNCSKCYRNISTNERAASVTLFHLRHKMSYTIKVAAVNNAGIGRYFTSEPIKMDKETLEYHLKMNDNRDTSTRIREIVASPWFIAVVGVVLWIMLFLLIVAIWYWKKRGAKKSNAHYLSTPFIKINDGSVLTTARDALWMDHSPFNTAQRNPAAAPNSQIFNDLRINTGEAGRFYGAAPGENQQGPPPQQLPPMDGRSPPPSYDAAANPMANPEVIRATLARQHKYDKSAADLMMYEHQQQQQRANSQQNLSTFYHQVGGGALPPDNESPTPYATTTLVMGGHRNNVLSELRRNVIPTLPHTNPPSNPPPNFRPGGRNPPINSSIRPSNQSANQSPPTTDISYVHSSSDGTGGSGSGQTSRRGGTGTGVGGPTLMDFIPPPPDDAPPPMLNDAGEYFDTGGSSQHDQYFQLEQPSCSSSTSPPPPSNNNNDNIENAHVHGGKPKPAPRNAVPKSAPTKRRKQQGASLTNRRGGGGTAGRSSSSSHHNQQQRYNQMTHGEMQRHLEQRLAARTHGDDANVDGDDEEYDYETLNDLLRSFHSSDPLDKERAQRFLQTHRPSCGKKQTTKPQRTVIAAANNNTYNDPQESLSDDAQEQQHHQHQSNNIITGNGSSRYIPHHHHRHRRQHHHHRSRSESDSSLAENDDCCDDDDDVDHEAETSEMSDGGVQQPFDPTGARSPAAAGGAYGGNGAAGRPNQPVMGINASSALSGSITYEVDQPDDFPTQSSKGASAGIGSIGSQPSPQSSSAGHGKLTSLQRGRRDRV